MRRDRVDRMRDGEDETAGGRERRVNHPGQPSE
jgi:hypothetical protein